MSSFFAVFFQDMLGSVLAFPFWWYGAGFMGVLQWMKQELSFRWRSYAIGLWMKNFFAPMYGQNDWTGRLVSVVMRFVVIVGRLIGIGFETFAYGMFAIAWVFAPVIFLLLFLWSFTSGAFLTRF